MVYEFEFLESAQKQLEQLDPQIAKRIVKKLQWFEKRKDPFSYAVILRESKIGDVRFCIGDYRVVAFVDSDKKKIIIAAIGHRREIHR